MLKNYKLENILSSLNRLEHSSKYRIIEPSSIYKVTNIQFKDISSNYSF
jgi:hypothetical protein